MSVDSSLYEAAAIDGANGWAKFRYVILPSIKTIIVLNMILSITGSLSVFEPAYVITGGAFGTGTYFVIMNKLAHESQKVGLASAMAIVLLDLDYDCDSNPEMGRALFLWCRGTGSNLRSEET